MFKCCMIMLLLKSICDSLGKILSEWFWGHWVPAFFVNLNSSVKFAEQKIATPIKLLDIFWLHFISHLIEFKYFCLSPLYHLIVCFFSIVFAELIFVFNNFLSHLKSDKSIMECAILTAFDLMDLKMHLVFLIPLVRILTCTPVVTLRSIIVVSGVVYLLLRCPLWCPLRCLTILLRLLFLDLFACFVFVLANRLRCLLGWCYWWCLLRHLLLFGSLAPLASLLCLG